jgi:glycosyltransferase involved in cell wall biosynthesis
MDRANYALARHLADRGDEIHLVAFRAEPDLLACPNVTLHQVPKPLNSYFLGMPLLSRAGVRVARRLAPSGARVVVNGGNCPWGDVNWVHHVHVVDAPRVVVGSLRRFKNRMVYRHDVASERSAVRSSKLVITTCEKNRQDILNRIGGVEAGRVHVSYYGLDTSKYRPASGAERAAIRSSLGWAPDRPTAIFVGGLGDRRKGFDILFSAWTELCRDSSWDADLVVLGRGAESSVWAARATELGLSDRIRLMGFIPEPADIFRAADAHVLPSRYEGYSLVTLEALGCGIPAFITTQSGIAERYPEALSDYLLSDPEDIPTLVQRLRAWRAALGRPNPALQAFTEEIQARPWDRMAAEMVEIIENARV